MTGRIGDRAFSVHAEGERMILKREGQARTEVDLGGPSAVELPLVDSAASRMPAEIPLPVCPDGSPQGDVVEDEVAPGGSPLDAGLRRLDACMENQEEPPTAEPGQGRAIMNVTTVSATAASHSVEPMCGKVSREERPRAEGRAKPQAPVSRDAQRVAAVILEVLAGVRTPTEAAAAVETCRCHAITSGSNGPWKVWFGPANLAPRARRLVSDT